MVKKNTLIILIAISLIALLTWSLSTKSAQPDNLYDLLSGCADEEQLKIVCGDPKSIITIPASFPNGGEERVILSKDEDYYGAYELEYEGFSVFLTRSRKVVGFRSGDRVFLLKNL